jgi:hypothetical protein
MGSVINAGADLLGIGPASKQANATTQAAQIGANASNAASAAQERMFNTQTALQEPFRQAGISGQNRLMELLGVGGDPNAAGYGSANKNFSMSDFQADPGYAFRLAEGQKALDRQAAMRGGLISGGALKAAQNYGQDAASQEYQNAFNRYQTSRSNLLNPLQSLAGVGQTATNQLGSAAGTYGTNMSNLALGAGANAGNAALAQGNIHASQYGTAGSAANTLWNNRNAISNWWNGSSTPTQNSGGYESLEF